MSRSGWAPGQLGHDVEHNELANEIVGLRRLATNSRSGNYTLVLADEGLLVEFTGATAATLTVPTAATVAFAVGTIIKVAQYGAGQVTIAGASGVTIRSINGFRTAGAYAEVTLRKRTGTEWILTGSVTP